MIQRYFWGALLLLLLSASSMFFTLDFELTWDDFYFDSLPPLRSDTLWSTLFTLPFSHQYMRPVAMLSFYAQRALAQVFSWPVSGMRHMHFIVLICYAQLLYGLFFSILSTFSKTYSQALPPRSHVLFSLALTLLTFWHPAHAEISGWGSGRFDLLANSFLVASALILWHLLPSYLTHNTATKNGCTFTHQLGTTRRVLLWSALTLTTLAALGSKEFSFIHIFIYPSLIVCLFNACTKTASPDSLVTPIPHVAPTPLFTKALTAARACFHQSFAPTCGIVRPLFTLLVICFTLALVVHQAPWRQQTQTHAFAQTEHFLQLPPRAQYPDMTLPRNSDGSIFLDPTIFDERLFNSIPLEAYSDVPFRFGLLAQSFLGQLNTLMFPWIYSGLYHEYTVPLTWSPSFLLSALGACVLLIVLCTAIVRSQRSLHSATFLALLGIALSFGTNPSALLVAYTSTADLFSDRFLSPALPFLSFLFLLLLLSRLMPIAQSSSDPCTLLPSSDQDQATPSSSNSTAVRYFSIAFIGVLILHALIFFSHLYAWRSDFTRAHYYALNSPDAITPASHLTTQYQAKGFYIDALSWAQKASSNASHSWPLLHARLQLQQAKLMYLNQDTQGALDLTDSLKPLLQKHHMFHELAEHYSFLGQVALDQQRFDAAFQLMQDALEQQYLMRSHYGAAIAWQQFHYFNVRLALHAQRLDIAWSSYLKTKQFENSFLLSQSSYNKEFFERQLCSSFRQLYQKHPPSEPFTPDTRFVFARPLSSPELNRLNHYLHTCTPSVHSEQSYPPVRFTAKP